MSQLGNQVEDLKFELQTLQTKLNSASNLNLVQEDIKPVEADLEQNDASLMYHDRD